MKLLKLITPKELSDALTAAAIDRHLQNTIENSYRILYEMVAFVMEKSLGIKQ